MVGLWSTWLFRDVLQRRLPQGAEDPVRRRQHLGPRGDSSVDTGHHDVSLTIGVWSSLRLHPPGTRHQVLSEANRLVLAIYEKPFRFIMNPPD